MKKKIIILGISIIILVGITIVFFIKGIKEDQQQMKDTMKKIIEEYEVFNNQIDTFNDRREELAEVINSGNLYYVNFSENISNVTKILGEYNDIRNKIINDNDYLKKYCQLYYGIQEINSRCQIFNESLTSVDKTFKKDIESYNKMIDDYNEWTKENSKYNKIEKYTIKEK